MLKPLKPLPSEEEIRRMEEETNHNVIPLFKALPGGKEPPQDSPHWLRNIPENYVFVACRSGEIAAVMMQVTKHMDRTSILFDLQHQTPAHVHTARFSHAYERLQIMPVVLPTEEENGRSDQPGQGLDQSPAPAAE